eukprot:CFRG1557T1
MFPGQGTQHVGMGKELFNNSPSAKRILEEADEALGYSLSNIMFEGPEDLLTKTENAQPAILIKSIAHFQTDIIENAPESLKAAVCFTGFSLGEYSALTAAGVLSVSDAVRLVHQRGKSMQECVVGMDTSMMALFPCSVELAEEIVLVGRRIGACDISNHNSSNQVTISGLRSAVDAAVAYAKTVGVKRCAELQVSCPFHSTLLKGAEQPMKDVLSITRIKVPTIPVISNVTAKPMSNPDEIRSLLVQQVCGRVRFADSVLTAREMGTTEFIEIGGGKNLIRCAEQTLKANKVV